MIRRLYLAILRDWIACQVLKVTLRDRAALAAAINSAREQLPDIDNADAVAAHCYGMANGMLRMRGEA